MLGNLKVDIIGQSLLDVTAEAARSHVLRDQNKLLLRVGMSATTQFQIRYKNGSSCWVEHTETNYMSEPEFQAIVINIRDITVQKSYEWRIKSSEAKSR